MRTAFIILALTVAGALADGFGNHRHNGNHRQGRQLGGSRRQGRNRAFRRGRQEEAAPLGSYGAASETTAAPEVLPPPDYDYGAEAPLGSYGADGAAADAAADANLAMLEKAVPGIPGEDYPILAEVPETAFSCDGQVDGGYYADPEAQCQVFHICTADGQGGLAKYSFLCPNGTIFNQNYFICDWWFNFDCSEAEGLYSLNEEIAAEREAASGAASDAALDSYGAAPAPAAGDYADYAGDYAAAADDYAAADYSAAEEVPVYAESTEAPAASGYGAPPDAAADAGILPTALPSYEEEREARRFNGRRGRNGRRNNSRNGRRGRNGRRQGRRQGRRFRG